MFRKLLFAIYSLVIDWDKFTSISLINYYLFTRKEFQFRQILMTFLFFMRNLFFETNIIIDMRFIE